MSIELAYFLIAAGIYAVILVGSLLMAKRKKVTTRDLLLADAKPLGVMVLIFTFAATLMSAFFMVGMPGFSYSHGALLWPYVIFGDVLGLLALYLVGLKFIEKNQEYDASKEEDDKAISPLEVIFPDSASRILCLAIVSLFIVPYLGVQIGGFGKLIATTSNGEIPVVFASFATLFFIWLYSSISGIRGIAYSDLVQGSILIVAAISVSSWFITKQFGGFQPFFNSLANHPTLLTSPGPKGFGTYPILFSSMIMFTAIMITQPQFLTRLMLIGKSNPRRYLRNLILGLGVALSLLTLPVLFMGLGGAVAYPDLQSGDQLLGRVLTDHMPLFIGICVSVGVLAAAMSTADSILFSISQMLTKDVLIDGFGLSSSEKSTRTVVRLALVGLALFAFFVGLSSNQLIVQLSGLSFAGCLQVAPAIIGGLWDHRYSALAGLASMGAGVLVLLVITGTGTSNVLGFHPSIPSVLAASVVYLIARGRGTS